VELLTQAEIFVETGAARTGATARSKAAETPRHLREDIETSVEWLPRVGWGTMNVNQGRRP
jgi:hypothetical protein